MRTAIFLGFVVLAYAHDPLVIGAHLNGLATGGIGFMVLDVLELMRRR